MFRFEMVLARMCRRHPELVIVLLGTRDSHSDPVNEAMLFEHNDIDSQYFHYCEEFVWYSRVLNPELMCAVWLLRFLLAIEVTIPVVAGRLFDAKGKDLDRILSFA